MVINKIKYALSGEEIVKQSVQEMNLDNKVLKL